LPLPAPLRKDPAFKIVPLIFNNLETIDSTGLELLQDLIRPAFTRDGDLWEKLFSLWVVSDLEYWADASMDPKQESVKPSVYQTRILPQTLNA